MAPRSHFRRRGPGGKATRTNATAMAAPATAWPDGNEKPEVSTSGIGGRPRWKKILNHVRSASEAAHVRMKANIARNRRVNNSSRVTMIRSGIVTIPPPATLRNRKSPVSTTFRMSSIQV